MTMEIIHVIDTTKKTEKWVYNIIDNISKYKVLIWGKFVTMDNINLVDIFLRNKQQLAMSNS